MEKIKSGNVTAGAGDSAAATHTTEFTLNVETAGPGCLVFTAPDAKAPQLDKFDIKSPGTPVPPISAVELEAAVEAAKGLDLNDYKDDDAKTAFTAKLAEAEKTSCRHCRRKLCGNTGRGESDGKRAESCTGCFE